MGEEDSGLGAAARNMTRTGREEMGVGAESSQVEVVLSAGVAQDRGVSVG